VLPARRRVPAVQRRLRHLGLQADGPVGKRGAGPAVEGVSDDHGILGLFAVENDVLRGGQPNAAGWLWLRDHGVHTVIKLNTESEASESLAVGLGFNVVRFPIPWWRQTLWRPRDYDLHAAVGIITSRIAPVFVHCYNGWDRSGLVIGCFRLSQGWAKDDAYDEMISLGFHPALQGLQGRWDSVKLEDFL
jgi:hypothetical protein